MAATGLQSLLSGATFTSPVLNTPTITGPTITGGGSLAGTFNVTNTGVLVPPTAIDDLAQLGIVGWNYPSLYATGNTAALVSGTVFTMLIPLTGASVTVTNVLVNVTTAGSTLTASECFAAIFDNNGTRIGVTADQSVAWTSTGLKTMALASGPFTGTWPFVVAAVLSNGTTGPIMSRGSGGGSGSALVNLSATGATLICATNGTGQTTMPGTLTYASGSGPAGASIWVGLS